MPAAAELLVCNVIDPEKAWSGQHVPNETLWARRAVYRQRFTRTRKPSGL